MNCSRGTGTCAGLARTCCSRCCRREVLERLPVSGGGFQQVQWAISRASRRIRVLHGDPKGICTRLITISISDLRGNVESLFLKQAADRSSWQCIKNSSGQAQWDSLDSLINWLIQKPAQTHHTARAHWKTVNPERF